MQGVTLTVSQLNDYVRRSLASDPILQNVTLRGEISNFKVYASGHWYFTLKDETGRIDCALFRQYTYGVRFAPRDGMRVLVTGSAGLYVQAGKYQFYADGMKQDGVGDLYQRYMELKEKLTQEGLFDVSVRSKRGHTINAVCSQYGGGGHKNAAAAKKLSRNDLKKIYKTLEKMSENEEI